MNWNFDDKVDVNTEPRQLLDSWRQSHPVPEKGAAAADKIGGNFEGVGRGGGGRLD